jgi:hypothetical protein
VRFSVWRCWRDPGWARGMVRISLATSLSHQFVLSVSLHVDFLDARFRILSNPHRLPYTLRSAGGSPEIKIREYGSLLWNSLHCPSIVKVPDKRSRQAHYRRKDDSDPFPCAPQTAVVGNATANLPDHILFPRDCYSRRSAQPCRSPRELLDLSASLAYCANLRLLLMCVARPTPTTTMRGSCALLSHFRFETFSTVTCSHTN